MGESQGGVIRGHHKGVHLRQWLLSSLSAIYVCICCHDSHMSSSSRRELAMTEVQDAASRGVGKGQLQLPWVVRLDQCKGRLYVQTECLMSER